MSWIEVGVNTMALWLWKEKVGPYMQLLHFAFGAGLGGSSLIYGFIVDYIVRDLKAFFWLLAIFIAIVAVMPIKLASPPIEKDVTEMEHGMPQSADEEEGNETIDPAEAALIARKQKIRFYIIIPLIAGFMFLYGGAENIFGTWMATYAQKVYEMDEASAAYIEAVFWAALTAGRLASVPLASRLSSRILLLVDMLGVILALVIGVLFEGLQSIYVLWFVTIVVGFFMASVFATAFTIPSELRVKGKMSRAASAFIVASGMGDMALPYVAGWVIVGLGPSALFYTMLVVFCACLLLYTLAYTYGLSTIERRLPEMELKEISQLDNYWG